MATTFVDGVTPLNAAAMNGIEDEIADVSDSIDAVASRTPSMAARDGKTSINSNDDLDDYRSVGTYYAASNSIATSLGNCPATVGFVMWVTETDGNGYVAQIILTRTAIMYTRYYNPSSGWAAWYRMDRTAV